MNKDKKSGDPFIEFLKEFLALTYINLAKAFVEVKTEYAIMRQKWWRKRVKQAEKDKAKAAPLLNFFASIFFFVDVGMLLAKVVFKAVVPIQVFAVADGLFIILMLMLPVSAAKPSVCKDPDDYEDMLMVSTISLVIGLMAAVYAVFG